jgi:DNA polymerase-1
VREALGDPTASLDSQPKLLRSLHRAGVLAESTSQWELAEYRHPVIEPLLEYKKLSRLLSANGWSWLAEWVHDGRFRPVYVPGGVVTGRWASSGGGALQIPRQLRGAVRADHGWRLVIADVAQLEPRVLAAMARDTALADAARGKDLYVGIVGTGAVALRSEAKVAMLGAMYGATTGDSGRLVPRLRRTFPRAMALVDDAARTGENGGVVTTWLGRSSPPPSTTWHDAQSRASEVEASGIDETRARRSARDRGRFTRNFVVQGTAAEWALAWMADLRGRLAAMPPVAQHDAAPRSGPVFATRAHLAFFLHDEVMIHAPAERVDEAVAAVRDSAAAAGRLLFGDFPIDFPLELRVAESAEKG